MISFFALELESCVANHCFSPALQRQRDEQGEWGKSVFQFVSRRR